MKAVGEHFHRCCLHCCIWKTKPVKLPTKKFWHHGSSPRQALPDPQYQGQEPWLGRPQEWCRQSVYPRSILPKRKKWLFFSRLTTVTQFDHILSGELLKKVETYLCASVDCGSDIKAAWLVKQHAIEEVALASAVHASNWNYSDRPV